MLLCLMMCIGWLVNRLLLVLGRVLVMGLFIGGCGVGVIVECVLYLYGVELVVMFVVEVMEYVYLFEVEVFV